MPTRANSAYAHLAYQSTIIGQVIEDVLETYVGNESSASVKELECSQLVREDAVVPENEILYFVERLREYKAQLDRELNCFEFVRKNDDEQVLGPRGHLTLNPTAGTYEAKAPQKRKRRRGSRGGSRSQEES